MDQIQKIYSYMYYDFFRRKCVLWENLLIQYDLLNNEFGEVYRPRITWKMDLDALVFSPNHSVGRYSYKAKRRDRCDNGQAWKLERGWSSMRVVTQTIYCRNWYKGNCTCLHVFTQRVLKHCITSLWLQLRKMLTEFRNYSMPERLLNFFWHDMDHSITDNA